MTNLNDIQITYICTWNTHIYNISYLLSREPTTLALFPRESNLTFALESAREIDADSIFTWFGFTIIYHWKDGIVCLPLK